MPNEDTKKIVDKQNSKPSSKAKSKSVATEKSTATVKKTKNTTVKKSSTAARKTTKTPAKKKSSTTSKTTSTKKDSSTAKRTSKAKTQTVKKGEYNPNLLSKYREEIIPLMMKRLGYKNVLQVPKIEKISLNIGLGRARDEAGSLDHAVADMTTIAGQRAVITRARKAISNFKIREKDPVGCRVTLRHWKMYEFLERLISTALPRVRDFNGLAARKFDGRGNYNFGLDEQIVFPEIDYDKIDKIRGLEITIVTSAQDDKSGYELLKALGFPFRTPNRFEKNETEEMAEVA